jgi:hypothetical protein
MMSSPTISASKMATAMRTTVPTVKLPVFGEPMGTALKDVDASDRPQLLIHHLLLLVCPPCLLASFLSSNKHGQSAPSLNAIQNFRTKGDALSLSNRAANETDQTRRVAVQSMARSSVLPGSFIRTSAPIEERPAGYCGRMRGVKTGRSSEQSW